MTQMGIENATEIRYLKYFYSSLTVKQIEEVKVEKEDLPHLLHQRAHDDHA